MANAPAETPQPPPGPVQGPSDNGTVIAWTASTGDSTKSHIVHVGTSGLAWVLNLKQPEVFGKLVGAVDAGPREAAALIEAGPKGKRLPRERVARVTWAESLNQLTII